LTAQRGPNIRVDVRSGRHYVKTRVYADHAPSRTKKNRRRSPESHPIEKKDGGGKMTLERYYPIYSGTVFGGVFPRLEQIKSHLDDTG